MRGLFIEFEGGDGSGKTTQANLLKDYLESLDKEVVLIREPGGTPIGEKIRGILLSKESSEMEDWTEAYLYAASRAEIVRKVIEPALKEGKIVIADRYFLSSLAYQGVGRRLKPERVLEMNKEAMSGFMPDLIILLDVPPLSASLRTVEEARDRIEEESAEFHRRVYEAFNQFHRDLNLPITKIDGQKSVEEVFSRVKKSVDKLLEEK